MNYQYKFIKTTVLEYRQRFFILMTFKGLFNYVKMRLENKNPLNTLFKRSFYFTAISFLLNILRAMKSLIWQGLSNNIKVELLYITVPQILLF